jgi:dTDP-glucose pyrophosphorylase
MKKSFYKVLITASGTGGRLGDSAKYSNKTLIRVGKKPVISYIIENYPKDTDYIVTLGHFGQQVKDFLELAYPERHFTFVDVDNYEGKGSSLGYSMLQAAPYLQSPFIFHASDTIITEKVPYPKMNWIAGYAGEGSSHYASFNMLNNKVQKIMEKGILNPDYLHIGLIGIKDYDKFWSALRKLVKNNVWKEELGDIHVLNDLLQQGNDFKINDVTTWFDTGNTDALKKAKESFQNLDKLDESIYIINDKSVIKFYSDEEAVTQRVERAKILAGLVPKITAARKNFYVYKHVKGDLYSDVANPVNFKDLLLWAKRDLWRPVHEVSDDQFRQVCYDFYFNKTTSRINKFFETRRIKDREDIINDEKIPKVKDLIKQIDFTKLSEAKQTGFHGDFIPDNIIRTQKGFCLLDWRNNFGGLLKAGDIYYDLAKLNHNLTINHQIVSNDMFTIKIDDNKIECDILRKENLVQCQNLLFRFLEENNYDSKKVKLLTSLVWFSSSPLHHHPYDTFLFYFAKLNLWRTLNEKN